MQCPINDGGDPRLGQRVLSSSDSLCEVQVASVRLVTDKTRPIAMLLAEQGAHAPPVFIGHTEWRQDDDDHLPSTTSISFNALITFDPNDLPNQRDTLQLQIRNVTDPFWDADDLGPNDAIKTLIAFPLLGQATFNLQDCLGKNLSLNLNFERHDGGDYAGEAVVRVEMASGWLSGRLRANHACVHYCAGLAPRRIRFAEHLLPTLYGYTVPRAVLQMLLADAELQAAGPSPDLPPPPPAMAKWQFKQHHRQVVYRASLLEGSPHQLLMSADLPPEDWAELSATYDRALEFLEEARSRYAVGFKPSRLKAIAELTYLPTNLQLNILQVGGDNQADNGNVRGQNTAMWPTLTVGALAAHAHGWAHGGAAAMARQLRQLISKRDFESKKATIELSKIYGRRVGVLMCQAFAALAASFSLSCQAYVAGGDLASRAWFGRLTTLGYLLQIESLLTTRGDEWAMIQDVRVAVDMMQRAHLMLLPSDHAQPATQGFTLKGDERMPILCFSPQELGFRNAEDAASVGFNSGELVRVFPVLFTQGINEEQNVANLMHTNTDEQAEINKRAFVQLSNFVASFENFSSERPGAAVGHDVLQRQKAVLERARRSLCQPAHIKNVEMLQACALLTRLLGGGRVIMCKSGKDRTAMALTLENSNLLVSEHGLDNESGRRVLDATRRHGVRRENVRRNICRRTYAFNWVQQRMLPEDYRPPLGAARGGQT